MRIALFGGSFNPPHVAHQLVALDVLETRDVDALWFVPAYTHVFGKPLVAYEHRVAMCRRAAAALGPRASVSEAEGECARRPGFVASRTFDLLEQLAQDHPGDTFRLVIGSDILGETAKWYRWDDVARLAPPIVVPRPGFAGGHGVAMPDISATAVRSLLAAGDPAVESLVPRAVLSYIADHGLYR